MVILSAGIWFPSPDKPKKANLNAPADPAHRPETGGGIISESGGD